MKVDFDHFKGKILYEEEYNAILNANEKSNIALELVFIQTLRPVFYKDHDGTFVYSYENGVVVGRGNSPMAAVSDFYKNFHAEHIVTESKEITEKQWTKNETEDLIRKFVAELRLNDDWEDKIEHFIDSNIWQTISVTSRDNHTSRDYVNMNINAQEALQNHFLDKKLNEK